MRAADQERPTEIVPVPTDAPIHRLDNDLPRAEITARMEVEAPREAPIPSPPLAPPARKHAAPRPTPLPRWVLPYVIGCLALALLGALVLWRQARVLGHF